MYVYEAVASILHREGVECMFGLMGSDVLRLTVACTELGIDYYSARHENQAVAMADGYSRATGRIGVAAVTIGPGFTNALTAINTASRNGSRVVVITGGEYGESPKNISGQDVCRAIGISSYNPNSGNEIVGDVRAAFANARANVASVLNLPVGILESTLESSDELSVESSEIGIGPIAPKQDAISNVASLLESEFMVSRPVILAGRGAALSHAGPSLRRLGDRIGAILCTSLRAPGLFFGEQFNAGYAGTFSTSVATEYFMRADCLLVFGASLNKFTTFGKELFPRATIVQVDVNDEAFGRHMAVDPELRVLGDARLAADAIVDELDKRSHTGVGFRTPRVGEALEQFDRKKDFMDVSRSNALDPRALAIAVDEMLPQPRVAVVDGGWNSTFWIKYLTVEKGEDFIQTSYVGGAGSIGLGTGAAIGAAVGRPGDLVVACLGDGGHMMALGDVETAVRYKLPMVFVIGNDQALGAETHFLDLVGMPTHVAEMETPSFADVAVALGAEGWLVTTPADLEKVGARIQEPIDGPIVVDCRVDPSVRPEVAGLVWGERLSL